MREKTGEEEREMEWKTAAEILLALFLGINTYLDLKKRVVVLWSIPLFAVLGFGLIFWFDRDRLSLSLGGLLLGLSLTGFSRLTNQAIGSGDGLAVAVCGIYMGFWAAFSMLFCALVICAVTGAVLLLIRKGTYRTELPFLPFLFAGYGCLCLVGGAI